MKTGRPVVRIAHAYGNSPADADTALAADVDMIEVDLWYQGGQLYIRHERRVRGLPILYDRRMPGHKTGPLAIPLGHGYFMRPDIHRFTLDQLLERVNGKKRLLIDLKGFYPAPHLEAFVQKLVTTIRTHHAESWVVICGQVYTPLHRLREAAPDLEVRYSIQRPYHWERFLRLMVADPPARATCIAYGFIDEEKTRILGEGDINVYCWTVDTPSEALRLVNEGVDGIISNNLKLLADLPRAATTEPTRPLAAAPEGTELRP